MYGYFNRVRSSRRLARECRLNVEVMWLTRHLQPGFKIFAEFRRAHPKPLKKVFREYILLLKEWELIGGKRIAVDGTEIHAQNARKKNFNDAKLKRLLDRIDEALEEFSRLDQFEESEERSVLVARTQDAMDVFKARKAEYESLREKLSESDDKQISLSDPDARALMKHGKESLVGNNIQSVVDDANKRMIHPEATNENTSISWANWWRILTNCSAWKLVRRCWPTKVITMLPKYSGCAIWAVRPASLNVAT